MSKIAVIFPGVGYTKDRPLLYYAGKLAANYGYETVFMDFAGISWNKQKLKDPDFLQRTLEICLTKTEKALEGIGDLCAHDAVFISKSIGTVVATAYEKQKKLNVRQICFSPLEMIGSYVRDEGAVLFCGDADPYAEYKALEQIAAEKRLKINTIKGGNHSLEMGDIFTDIDNMKDMMRIVDEIVRK